MTSVTATATIVTVTANASRIPTPLSVPRSMARTVRRRADHHGHRPERGHDGEGRVRPHARGRGGGVPSRATRRVAAQADAATPPTRKMAPSASLVRCHPASGWTRRRRWRTPRRRPRRGRGPGTGTTSTNATAVAIADRRVAAREHVVQVPRRRGRVERRSGKDELLQHLGVRIDTPITAPAPRAQPGPPADERDRHHGGDRGDQRPHRDRGQDLDRPCRGRAAARRVRRTGRSRAAGPRAVCGAEQVHEPDDGERRRAQTPTGRPPGRRRRARSTGRRPRRPGAIRPSAQIAHDRRGSATPVAHGEQRGLRSVGEPQLGEHARHVGLDRLLGHEQLVGELRGSTTRAPGRPAPRAPGASGGRGRDVRRHRRPDSRDRRRRRAPPRPAP